MVIGEGITKERAGEIVNETTGGDLRPLEAEDLDCSYPAANSVSTPSPPRPASPHCPGSHEKYSTRFKRIGTHFVPFVPFRGYFETIPSGRT